MFVLSSDFCLCLSSPQGCTSRRCSWSWLADTWSGMTAVAFKISVVDSC